MAEEEEAAAKEEEVAAFAWAEEHEMEAQGRRMAEQMWARRALEEAEAAAEGGGERAQAKAFLAMKALEKVKAKHEEALGLGEKFCHGARVETDG